jgi:curved DNA-binding protein CbpA
MAGELAHDLAETEKELPPPPAGPEPSPSEPSAPAPGSDSDDQRKREEELLSFLDQARGKDYYQLFGLKANQFDFSKLKTEYFRLAKLFSPEHYVTSPGSVLERAEEALALLATAYNTLSNVVSKEKYDEMLAEKGPAGVPGAKDHDKMQAEVAFQSGMAFLEMGDWDGAEKALAEAAALAPANTDILAHYAYALYNKNRKSKSIQKRVNELITRSLKLNPRCAPALAYRGAMLLEDDKPALAETDFKKALAINPRYRFALKGLKKVEQKKQEEKKGLFGMFRK